MNKTQKNILMFLGIPVGLWAFSHAFSLGCQMVSDLVDHLDVNFIYALIFISVTWQIKTMVKEASREGMKEALRENSKKDLSC